MVCCNYWLLVNDMLKCLLDNLHFEWQKSEPTMFFDENSCWRVEFKRLLYSLALNMFSHSSSELLVEDTGFCWRYRNWKIAGADNLARNLCCSTRLFIFHYWALKFHHCYISILPVCYHWQKCHLCRLDTNNDEKTEIKRKREKEKMRGFKQWDKKVNNFFFLESTDVSYRYHNH